jgi:hypothetical protein
MFLLWFLFLFLRVDSRMRTLTTHNRASKNGQVPPRPTPPDLATSQTPCRETEAQNRMPLRSFFQRFFHQWQVVQVTTEPIALLASIPDQIS